METKEEDKIKQISLVLHESTIEHIEEIARRYDRSFSSVADEILRKGNLIPLLDPYHPFRDQLKKP